MGGSAVTPVTHIAAGAFEGDSIVWLRTGGSLVRCYAQGAKAQRIIVDGQPCDHVADAQDGTWIYDQRPW